MRAFRSFVQRGEDIPVATNPVIEYARSRYSFDTLMA